jgi:diguanylate cyclase (GGDEF)-like protein/PAS domain S-box-containing protein
MKAIRSMPAHVLPRPTAPPLRTKLLIAFAVVACATAACGALSLSFVNRIGNAIMVYADITSPLQAESAALIDTAQRMRTYVFKSIGNGTDPQTISTQLNSLDEESRVESNVLGVLADQAGVRIELESVAEIENQYTAVLHDIIEKSRTVSIAAALNEERRVRFESLRRNITDQLRAIVNRADGFITESEEKAKIDSETGNATVATLADVISELFTEINPRLRDAYKVMREIEELDDIVKVLAGSGSLSISDAERTTNNTLKRINLIMAGLQGRLREKEAAEAFVRLQQSIADLRESLLGGDGLVKGYGAAVSAQAEISQGRETLEAIDRKYFDLLRQVQKAVTALNVDARAKAESDVVNARSVVIGASLLAVLGALLLAGAFARRITGPLTRLANHAVTISETGEMNQLPDDLVGGGYDEIDKLVHSFNAMIVELGDARSRLIDWSKGEIQTQYERLSAAINNMPLGLCMFDAEQKLIVCNRRYAEIYGVSEEHTHPGTPLEAILEHRLLVAADARGGEDMTVERLAAIRAGKPWFEINEFGDGRIIAMSYHPLSNGGSVAIHEDVTERRKAEQRINHMAHHDALTDLPNRVHFREEMTEALRRVADGEKVAVLYIDLDHFKDVNDTLGHPIGDVLLRQVSERLRDCVRPSDAVARLGGDEFAVVQTAANQPVSATAMANRIIKELAVPFDLDGHQAIIGASIGISIAPDDGADADALLKKADMALYRAKEDGRGIYCFFEPEMDARMQRRRALELDLRKALVLEQFEVHYQPLLNLESNEISGFEALVRWRHPERGLVQPNDFIPLAEETGLIVPIGNWVLNQACGDATMWPDHVKIAVNLSPLQFNKTLVLDVISALSKSGLAPKRLELEITETVLLQDTDSTIAVLNQLHDVGVRIAMDDFGTGYSSLSYLRKFAFDKIKIDRSFINDMDGKEDSMAIVRAVTGLGATLGMSTTAEGVETVEQLRQLRLEGCTEAQGFLISKPRAASELADLLGQPTKFGKAAA